MCTLAFFWNQLVEHVAVDAGKTNLFFGALDLLDPVTRDRRVEQYHVVALSFSFLNVAVLAVFVGRVEHHFCALFVGLQRADFLEVLVDRVVLVVYCAAEQAELLRTLKKLVVGHHSVLDNDGDVLELLLEVGAVGLEHFFELVGNFFGNVAADFFDVSVGLQVAARYVQRNVLRVDDPVQHHQEFRNDSLDVVGDKNLRLVELDFVLVQLHVGLDFREEQNSGQIKRVVHVHVDVKERLLKRVGVEGLVERLVVFVGKLAWLFGPRGAVGVDYVGNFFGFPLRVFAFGGCVVALVLLATDDGHAHESCVLLQQLVDLELLEKFFGIAVNV